MVLEVIECVCGWKDIPEEVAYVERHNEVTCPKCHSMLQHKYRIEDIKEAIAARRGKVKLNPEFSIDKPL